MEGAINLMRTIIIVTVDTSRYKYVFVCLDYLTKNPEPEQITVNVDYVFRNSFRNLYIGTYIDSFYLRLQEFYRGLSD